MIVLYTTLFVLLSVSLFLIIRRASRLKRHFVRLAAQANELLKAPPKGRQMAAGQGSRAANPGYRLIRGRTLQQRRGITDE